MRKLINSYILNPISKLHQFIWKSYVPTVPMKFQYEIKEKELLPDYFTDGSVGLDLSAKEDTIIPCNKYFKENQELLKEITGLIVNSQNYDKVIQRIEKLNDFQEYPVTLVPLNISSEYPENMWGLLVSRGGLSIKRGLIQSNAIGVIDIDFVKEHKLPLINITNKDIVIKKGERIAQLLLMPWYKIKQYEGKVITHENHNGFHSTGIKSKEVISDGKKTC